MTKGNWFKKTRAVHWMSYMGRTGSDTCMAKGTGTDLNID